MIDREKVIKGLECCIEADDEACPKECPFYKECLTDNRPFFPAIRAALELLKEQEAKTVLYMEKRFVIQVKAMSGFCPKCSHTLMYGMNKHFCGNCGQAVKWYD